MCSSFKIKIDLNELKEIFDWISLPRSFIEQSEKIIYPSQEVEIITLKGVKRMSWGINLSFIKRKLINIRYETLYQKFPNYSKNRACIPIYSFFEWTKHNTFQKKNIEIIPSSKLIFLGLVFDNNQNSFSLLTQKSPTTLTKIHHRIPYLIEKENILKYLKNIYHKNDLEKINFETKL